MDRNFATNEQRNFYTTGVVLLMLALFDVGNLVTSIINDVYDVNTYAAVGSLGLARFIVGFFLSLSVLTILVQVLLGAKAMSEAKAPTAARAHIVIAKIAGIVNAVLAVLGIIGLFVSEFTKSELMSVIATVIDVSVMFVYVYEARKVRAK